MLAFNDKKILIVEDEDDIVDLLLMVLQEGENEIDVANNGSDAIAMIRSKKSYDLIISDFNLPMMSGIKLYQEIKSINPELAHKMFFISGDPIGAEIKELFGSDKPRFLFKPFAIKNLRQQLELFFLI